MDYKAATHVLSANFYFYFLRYTMSEMLMMTKAVTHTKRVLNIGANIE